MDKTKMIVCFGDSNTYGYDAKTDGRFTHEQRWPCILGNLLSEGYLVREEGLGGRTTVFDDPLYEGLSGLSFISPCMLTHAPVDLLIIMLGTNDTKERFAANAHNISRGMERLVAKAMSTENAWKDKKRVLVIAPPHICSGYYSSPIGEYMGKGCDKKSEDLAKLYEDSAKKFSWYFLDAQKIEGVKMGDTDYMHLTLESHEKLAQHLADYIKNKIFNVRVL